MIGFEETATGYRATPEQVAWWESRDTCPDPDCGAVVEPVGKTPDGRWQYQCPIDREEWTRKP